MCVCVCVCVSLCPCTNVHVYNVYTIVQVLYEDNQLKESLSLLKIIAQYRFLGHASLIVFLNKTDLFEQQIKDSNISDYFSDFKGESLVLS